jgi:hypothetical protein
MTLDIALSNAIAYLMYTLTLAVALQVGIDQLKPFIITPLREALKISDYDYLAFMYAVRGALTIIAYLWIWGGVAATRLAVPFLAFVPDLALGVVTVLFVISGESVINDLVDKLRAAKEAAEGMAIITTVEYPNTENAPTVDAQSARNAYERNKDR